MTTFTGLTSQHLNETRAVVVQNKMKPRVCVLFRLGGDTWCGISIVDNQA